MRLRDNIATYLPPEPEPFYYSRTYGYIPFMMATHWYVHLFQVRALMTPTERRSVLWYHSNDFATFGLQGSWMPGVGRPNQIANGDHRIPAECDQAIRAIAADMDLTMGPWGYQATDNGTMARAVVEMTDWYAAQTPAADGQLALF